MEANERAGPIGADRYPVYARYLKELDHIVTGSEEDRASAMRDWWERINSEMYPGDTLEEAIELLRIDHDVCGLPDYPTAQVFLELFEAFFVAGDRTTAERFLDQAFHTLGDKPRRSVARRVKDAEARFRSVAGTRDAGMATVRTSKGKIRKGHKKVLEALPSPKISVIVAETKRSESRVKLYVADLRRAGWVHPSKVNGMYARTADGESALANEKKQVPGGP